MNGSNNTPWGLNLEGSTSKRSVIVRKGLTGGDALSGRVWFRWSPFVLRDCPLCTSGTMGVEIVAHARNIRPKHLSGRSRLLEHGPRVRASPATHQQTKNAITSGLWPEGHFKFQLPTDAFNMIGVSLTFTVQRPLKIHFPPKA